MTTDLFVAAALAFAAVGLLHLWFAHAEIFLLWLLPIALVILFGAFAFSGERLGAAIVAGVVVGTIVFGVRSFFLFRAHRAKLEGFAQALGLRFSKDDQTNASIGSMLFDESGRCFNIMSGSWRGVSVSVFGYRYADISDEPAVIEVTCATTTIEGELPRMLVTPLGLKESVRRWLDKRGRDAFDRRFQVHAPDPLLAKVALPVATRDWLLANANGRLLVDGHTIAFATGRSRMKQVPEMLDRIVDLRSTFR